MTSDDVNAYRREVCSDDLTATNLSTWAATGARRAGLRRICACQTSPPSTDEQLVAAVRAIAGDARGVPEVGRAPS